MPSVLNPIDIKWMNPFHRVCASNRCCRTVVKPYKMINIVGKYQHVRDENINEFAQILGVAYIDMMGMSNSELEITRINDEWRFETVTAMGVQTSVFTLDKEYEEITPSGVVLKNTTTLNGDSLITIFITRDGNVIIRRYDFTEDGLILKILLARSGQVAMRYFKRMNPPQSFSSWSKTSACSGAAAFSSGSIAVGSTPAVIAAAGFASAGIASGSIATSMIRDLGGGASAGGSASAAAHSFTVLGTVLSSAAATSVAVSTGAAAGASAGTVVGARVVHSTTRN